MVILEEATEHVSILVSNFSITIRNGPLSIAYEVGTKVIDQLIAFLMMRGAESVLPGLVAAKETSLVGTL